MILRDGLKTCYSICSGSNPGVRFHLPTSYMWSCPCETRAIIPSPNLSLSLAAKIACSPLVTCHKPTLIITLTSFLSLSRYFITQAAKIAEALTRDVHYTVDEKQKSVLLTEDGYEAVEDVLQVTDLYDPRTQWASYVVNGLKV